MPLSNETIKLRSSIGFLGTDPTLFAAPPDTRTVNYDVTDQEFAALNKFIKSYQLAGEQVDDCYQCLSKLN